MHKQKITANKTNTKNFTHLHHDGLNVRSSMHCLHSFLCAISRLRSSVCQSSVDAQVFYKFKNRSSCCLLPRELASYVIGGVKPALDASVFGPPVALTSAVTGSSCFHGSPGEIYRTLYCWSNAACSPRSVPRIAFWYSIHKCASSVTL
jgi:hypothetical protein